MDALPSLWLAAVLLLARTIAARYEALPSPSVDAILAATGASRSRAYELVARLAALLPTLVRAPGRPPRAQPSAPSQEPELTRAVLAYVMAHPGCVDRGSERQRYADAFRRFIIDLHATHASTDLETFARAVGVPLGTMKDWIRHPLSEPVIEAQATVVPVARPPDVEISHIQTVLHAWTRWKGSFIDFCEHVKRDLHVPFGIDFVRHLLEVEGQRKPARRKGRSPDEIAMRAAFRTYFPGAQWVGDGMQVPFVVDGYRFIFNVELNVDAYAGAFVGASVSDTEDSIAVIDTFASGVATTGAKPIALLLDNKPSNHAPDVDVALGDTIRIRATPERPQNKGHVEGAFGLFSQILPHLSVDTRASAHDLARRLLILIVDVWTRTTNHRPRKDRGGRSRIDLYGESPTDEQIERARRELRELADQQERSRRTLEARRRPEVLTFLDDQFARLRLLDPERHIRIAIAGYPEDAIVDGIFIFDGKRRANTLPDGVDARYLLGIVKNVAAKTEGEIIAEPLYRGRIAARDHFLAPLRAQREELRKEPDVAKVLMECVVQGMATDRNLERTFWLDVIVETIRAQPEAEREQRFPLCRAPHRGQLHRGPARASRRRPLRRRSPRPRHVDRPCYATSGVRQRRSPATGRQSGLSERQVFDKRTGRANRLGMTNTTNSQDLSKRIEHLVAEYISATRVAAQAAVDRAFATAVVPSARQRPTMAATAPARSRRTGARRAVDEIGALSERLYEAVCRTPGETMTVIAPAVGATARELNRPMLVLKQAGRIRSVGTRQATRYFPMARDAQRTSA